MTAFKFTKTALLMQALTNSIYAFSFFVLFFLASCSGGDADNRTNQDAVLKQPSAEGDTTGRAGRAMFTNELYTLYIENTAANPQLGQLLKNIGPGSGQPIKKLIFQFQLDRDGHLGLVVFPYKPGNQEIESSQVIEAKRSDKVETTLPNGGVSIGDLQVADRNGGKETVKILKDHVYGQSAYSPDWSYIWLVPEIKPISEGSFSKPYVVYKIMRDSDFPKAAAIATRAVPIDEEVNPSPPRRVE